MDEGRRVRADDHRGPAWDPAAAHLRLDDDLGWLPDQALRISDPRPPAVIPSPALLELTNQLAEQGR
jgi:hypothetical protein